MKGTMDGAAKRAQQVAQSILPDRPHHLSLSLDRKYPEPEGFWFEGRSAPLQYMTYLSDANRGILFTRPSFDICEEPPPPMPAKLPAKGEAKKKLSLKDYQTKKKPSASPTEDEPPSVKTETKLNGTSAGTVHAKPLPPKDEVKSEDIKVKAEEKEREREIERERDYKKPSARADQKSDKARPEPNGEKASRPLPSKSQPETESRKRNADSDGNPAPLKRAKNEPSVSKADAARARERATDKGHRESKGESLHPTSNGLPLVTERDRENTASPRSTIQVNGSRVRSDSGTSTPRKNDGASKLPMLLSPLHPSLFGADLEVEKPKKKMAEKAPSKAQRTEGPSPAKKTTKKQTLKLPDLLSPTLPPLVEAALLEIPEIKALKRDSASLSDDLPSGARKTIVAAAPTVIVEEEKPTKPSLMVTLKFKRANAKRVKDLLSLPSKSVKDALRIERALSAESTPPPARKRPRPADEIVEATASSKRTKMANDVVVAKPPVGPTTPLKQGGATAMSRVTSSQSQGNTPGNTAGLTPSAMPEPVQRPPTRSEPLDPATLAKAEQLKERYGDCTKLGSRLKHTRDNIYRERQRPSGGTAPPALPPSEERRAAALHFEMVLAYLIAFHSLGQARLLERRPSDITMWESLLPHFLELKKRVQHQSTLHALAWQLHALCLEQITNVFSTLDPAVMGPQNFAAAFQRWSGHSRKRTAVWTEAIKLCERVPMSHLHSDDEGGSRTSMGPWTTVEEAVARALAVIKRWAERDGVKWVPELAVEVEGAKEKEREALAPPLPPPPVARERDKEVPRGGDRERDGPPRGSERERDHGRDRERERERDRERERERDRDRELPPRPRDRDREREGALPPLPRDRERDIRDRDRDRDRGGRDRERDWDRERDHHRDHRDRDRERDRDRDRDRERTKYALNGTRH